MESQNLWKWKNHLFLFSDEFGQPLRPDSISQWWIRFTETDKYKEAKLKRIRFHDLRHTSATLLIDKGVHAKVIQERFGHSKISNTMDVYGHILQDTAKVQLIILMIYLKKLKMVPRIKKLISFKNKKTSQRLSL
ncbi:tyrosine-type recombinase/integrase [Gracilibacillus caseinilyticus]|uniref:Tyrosine-type recombinase/integrase n=1 Tax=Gracilibacillus caseinilyticus TaxID=2932256 RepID=A0ABY4ETP1_9BACI|nr:site-specific integrase [Gracilibacillus caseinilyticus]UOQ47253.1 tyrosine-type recombinase/integrase [Gracilibacillus caseinilyticus]